MDNTIISKARKINYYPLMWVLLVCSMLATLSFFFRVFIVNINGEAIRIYAYDLLDRSNESIINLPEYSILKNTILIGLSLGIVNICMSLWQAGYSRASRMKFVNSIRFAFTGVTLIIMGFLSISSSGGQVTLIETAKGALGINGAIYLFAYIFNLYYGVSDRVAIINYKAINAVALISGCFLWILPFLNVNGVEISGINAIYFPKILLMNYEPLNQIVRGFSPYGILSRIFLYKYAHNLLMNLFFVITNKSYRRFNLSKYIYSAAYSVFFAFFCIKVVGSTVEGTIGIIAIAGLYAFLALYTIVAYKLLKRKVYSSSSEEMLYDDDDKYYDEESRFIGNLPVTAVQSDESELVSVSGKTPQNKSKETKTTAQMSPSVKEAAKTEENTEPKEKFLPEPKPSYFRTKHERSYLVDEEEPKQEEAVTISFDKSDPEQMIYIEELKNQEQDKPSIKLVPIDQLDEEEEQQAIIPDTIIKKEQPINESDIEEVSEEEDEDNNEDDEEESEEELNDEEEIAIEDTESSKEDIADNEAASSSEEALVVEEIIEHDPAEEVIIEEEQTEEDNAEDLAAQDGEIEEEAISQDLELFIHEEEQEECEEEDLAQSISLEDIEVIEEEKKEEGEAIEEEVVVISGETIENNIEIEEVSTEALEEIRQPETIVESINVNVLEDKQPVNDRDDLNKPSNVERGSYTEMLKMLEDDGESDDITDYSKLIQSNKARIASLETEQEDKETIENLSSEDFVPEEIRRVIDDNFYNNLPYRNKKEFMNLFMNPNSLSISRIPQYVISGDNTKFFATVIKYLDVLSKNMSSELMLLLYEYVVSLYGEDTAYISNCNRKMLDACNIKGDREPYAIDISEEMCEKEIKLMLQVDLVKTMPIIKRLILIYIRKKKYDEALQLCETAIKLNFSDNTIGGYEGRKRRILRLIDRENRERE